MLFKSFDWHVGKRVVPDSIMGDVLILLQGKARAIHDRLVREWSRILGLPRNRPPLQFLCDEEETNYITQPRDAIPIYQAISHALEGPDTTTVVVVCRVFIDAFACVGGDTLAAMHAFESAHVYAIQLSTNAGRFRRLTANVREFNQVLSTHGRTTVGTHRAHAIGTDIRSFLTQRALGLLSDTNANGILYLDPPWGVDPLNPGTVSPLDDIHHFLDINVFRPLFFLRDSDSLPLLIVLKLPLEAEDIRAWPALREHYHLNNRLSIRNRFYVHIFKKNSHHPTGTQHHAHHAQIASTLQDLDKRLKRLELSCEKNPP